MILRLIEVYRSFLNWKTSIFVTLIASVYSVNVSALSVELQAVALNTAVNATSMVKADSLKTKINYLSNTLDSSESLILTQHPSLKVSSYLFLMQLWEQKSLIELLKMRGVNTDGLEMKLDDPKLAIPLYQFGSVAIPLNSCEKVSNPMTPYNLMDLYTLIGDVEDYLSVAKDSYAADGMLLIIKASTLIKLHDPLMTHAKATPKCLSDFEGSLTCADGFYDVDKTNENILKYRISQVGSIGVKDISMVNSLGMNHVINLFGKCYVPLRFFTSTGGMINPITDKQIVQLSEIIYSTQQINLHKTSSMPSWDAIFSKNKGIVDVIYNFPEYVKKNNLSGNSDDLIKLRNKYLKEALYKQIEQATLNTKIMISESTLL